MVTKASRPLTARRRPPRVKDSVTDGANANAASAGNTAFLAEGGGDSDSDDGGAGEDGGSSAGGGAGAGSGGAVVGTGKGKHTREILNDARKDGGASAAAESKDDGSGGIRLGGARLKRGGGRGGAGGGGALYTAKELDTLSETIQKLAASVNPLGKSMDYVTEDVEDMAAELRAWRADFKRRGDAASKEAAETAAALAPTYRQLAEMEEKVAEQLRKTAGLKATVSKNDARIQELLRMMVHK